MGNTMNEDTFIYRVDSTDTIIGVGDNWHTFANANAWTSDLPPEAVVGHTLWEFIQNPETQHVYQELFRRARAGTRSRPIPFRCDSPDERRFLELLIDAKPDGTIEITSTIIRKEPRSTMRLLAADTPRSTDFISICSMCKKIEVSPKEWTDIEEGIAQLKPFDAEEMPQLTHGLCPPCYLASMAELGKPEPTDRAVERDTE